ncbi:MAG: periplasmic heavy metal sensor [Proteobacteria bacterium]|nr:periplasmic heavy metal sensor [Pseudomonadota bacterium]
MTSSRVLTAVAVVSVILNLLLIGFFIGQRLPHFPGPWRGGPAFERGFARDDMPPPGADRRERMRVIMGPNDLNFGAAMRTLDPETRKTVQARFKNDTPEIRARVEEMTAKRRALLDVLAAAPADMERLSQALADVRAAAAAAQEHSHKLFMEIAGDLPPEQRAAFMKAAAENRSPRSPR